MSELFVEENSTYRSQISHGTKDTDRCAYEEVGPGRPGVVKDPLPPSNLLQGLGEVKVDSWIRKSLHPHLGEDRGIATV